MSQPKPDAVRTATIKHGVARLTILGVPHEAGFAAKFFQEIARQNINVDDIIQNADSAGDSVMLSFVVSSEQIDKARGVADAFVQRYPGTHADITANLARIRVVGIGMRSHSGVAAKLFSAVANEGINIENISTGEIVISILVPEADGNLALQAARHAFGLEEDSEIAD